MTGRQWALLCIPACFWGGAFILMALALPTFSPLVIVAGRMATAAVVLNSLLFIQKASWPSSPRLWLEAGGLSLLSNLLPFGLVVWGQQYIDASLAAILIASAPVFTVILASLTRQERLSAGKFLGVLTSFSGVTVIIGPTVLQGLNWQGIGELSMLAAALCYSLSGFWGRRFKQVSPVVLTTMTITLGALIIVPIAFLGEVLWAAPDSLSWQWSAGLAVLGLGVFSTAIAYIVYFQLLAEIGVVNTSLVSFLVPISAVVMGVLFLKEQLSPGTLLGMGLILTGLALIDGRLIKAIAPPS